MIIRKLNIFGFGKHENLSIEFTDGINILYGLNEAGKTTIQQFILHILFGFPTKNQQLLRYEPKSGIKYGGQVHIDTKSYGAVVIERVKGKASGDVTLYFEDGTRGGEEELQMILHQYDRQSFESIFSFSLLQLQGFEKMDEMELSRTLLASGTTGVDTLADLEKRMQKEMENLFKPSGRKPEMNKAFEELRELERNLKEARQQMEQYAPSVQRLSELERELEALLQEEEELRKDQTDLSLFRQAAPLLEQQRVVQIQLSRFQDISFPANGIRRMESLESRIIDIKTVIHQLKEELNSKQEDFDQSAITKELENLQDLLTRESEWHQWRSSEKELNTLIRRLKADENRLLSELGLSESILISDADLSLSREEMLHSLVTEYKQVEERIRFLQRQEEEKESERKEVILSLQRVNTLSEEEVESAAKWPSIQRKLSEAKAYLALSKGTSETTAKPYILLMILTVAGALFGGITSNWPVVFISIGILIVSIILYSSSKQKGKDEKVKEMESLVHRYAGKEEELDRLHIKWAKSTDEKERISSDLEQIQRKLTSLSSDRIEAERELTVIEDEIGAFAERLGLERTPSISLLPEIFKMMRDLQSIRFELMESEQELRNSRGRIERRYEESLSVLNTDFLLEEELYGAIRKHYSERLKVKTRMDQTEADHSAKQVLLEEKERAYSALLEEQNQLVKEAKVDSVEQFYEAFQKHKEKEDLQREAMQLDAQIKAIGLIDVELKAGREEVVSMFEENEERLHAIKRRQDLLQEEKVRLNHLTTVLLNDESYAVRLQEFEMKKAEVAEMAKKWSVYKSVSEAISRMLRNLKENKLPAVLNRAQFYFGRLTENKYTSMEVNDKGLFEAVSTDGMRYSIAELSQATKEQAYISLRFALAESLQSSAPFPIIMDDPFVHFDRGRLHQMVKLMSEMQHHQFLYFTCHDDMTKVWEDATVIIVNREKGAISI
ncbi:AAA family ATPase [Chungangia koreensis]|uniref:AAA family ATPase n=1 Tax=Chungangia koreensis TaxID=752657 RepID=A0ABV8XAX6_9LACT